MRISLTLIWTLKNSETSTLKFSKLKPYKWKLWICTASWQWGLHFIFENGSLTMPIWGVQKSENSPCEWRSCFEFKQLSFCHLPFLLRNEEVTGTPIGGWRWSHQDLICLTYLLFCLYKWMYSHLSGKSAYVNLWDLGSSPSGTLLPIFHIFWLSNIFCWRWALWAWYCFYFC